MSTTAIPNGRAALAGMVAAVAALSAGAFVAAFAVPAPGPISAVAGVVIDNAPTWLVDLGKNLFGTADKVALLIGIVVVSTALAALVGIGSARNRTVGTVAFVGFGALGLWAMWTDPEGTPLAALFSAAAAVLAGMFTLGWLLDRAASDTEPEPRAVQPAAAGGTAPPAGDPTNPPLVRRRFLTGVGAVGASAAVLAVAGSAVRSSRSTAEEARAQVSLKPTDESVGAAVDSAAASDVASTPGITPVVVDNDSFYRIDTAQFGTPQVDPANWSLRIEGMVDTPLELTYQDLLDRANVTAPVTLSCVSNEVGGPLVGNAIWEGLPLAELLQEAGIQPEATQVVGHSVDGWAAGFPTEAVFDGRTALLAVGMNGEPLPVRHGFPARLVISGLYGYVSATKWLSRIELTRWEDFDGYWIPRGWSKQGPVKTQSRIDTPRSGAEVAVGDRVAIGGVAWAPGTGIERVEVKVGDADWVEAELGESLGIDAWRQWRLWWDATAGDQVVEVRATDASGYTQTSDRAQPAPDGATGWHRIALRAR